MYSLNTAEEDRRRMSPTSLRSRRSTASGKSCVFLRSAHYPLMFVVLLLFHWTLSSAQGVDLCVVRSPLITQYLMGAVDDPVDCMGCHFKPTSNQVPDKNLQVHVIHVNSPRTKEVLVILKGAPVPVPSVSLVLHSSVPSGTRFTVTASEDTVLAPPTVLTSGRDYLSESEGLIQHHASLSIGVDSLKMMAQTRFGPITSFTTSDSANRIIIDLKKSSEANSSVTSRCDFSVRDVSPVTRCYNTRIVPVDGCYHQATLHQSGVHIMSVDGSHSDVTIELLGSDYWQPPPKNQNLTLVLTSPRNHVTWTLVTARIAGRISVVLGNNGAKLQHKSNSDVRVEVQRKDLPASFDQLMMLVLNNLGSLSSYSSSGASRLRLTVLPMPFLRDITDKWLTKECVQGKMIASFPRWVVDKVSSSTGKRLSLSTVGDSPCHSKENKTHLVLGARLDKCGFEKRVHMKRTYLFQKVVIAADPPLISDDEDLYEGSGSGLDDTEQQKEFEGETSLKHTIEVKCPDLPAPKPRHRSAYLPTTTSPSLTSSATSTTTTPMSSLSPLVITDDSYGLDVEVVSDNKKDHSHVLLKVRATLQNEMPEVVRIVIEECWMSGDEKPSLSRETLVKKSCAVNKAVDMMKRETNAETGFTFLVGNELRKLQDAYLHCVLGVCYTDREENGVKICKKPSSYCNVNPMRAIFFGMSAASHIHNITRGPLPLWRPTLPVDDLPKRKDGTDAKSEWESKGAVRGAASPSTGGQDSITEEGGITTMVVVFISVASFFIGVCLTGTLWIIHFKTDPRRHKGPDPCVTRHSGYDLSGNSGSTTPSSQAPITA